MGAEEQTAKAMERLVSRPAFGELLAMSTENVVALVHMGNGAMDTVWRNLRIAGRGDVARLGAQLARTEDKLELVLQELEELRAQRTDAGVASRPNAAPAKRDKKEKAKP